MSWAKFQKSLYSVLKFCDFWKKPTDFVQLMYEKKLHPAGFNAKKFNGGNLVVAILPSRMEVSYCTSGFFRS